MLIVCCLLNSNMRCIQAGKTCTVKVECVFVMLFPSFSKHNYLETSFLLIILCIHFFYG